MARTVIEEMVTLMGLDISDDGLSEFIDNLDSVETNLKKLSLVGVAAAGALTALIHTVVNGTDETVKFARVNDIAVNSLLGLEHAAGIAGVPVDKLRGSLESLNTLASQASREGSGVLGFLGISPTGPGGVKSAVALLGDVADKLKGLKTAQEKADFVEQLGMDRSMILFLEKGGDEVARLTAEMEQLGALLTPEQQKLSEEYADNVLRGRAALQGMANTIAFSLAPALNDLIGQFVEWRIANRDAIDGTLAKAAKLLLENLRPLLFIMVGIATAVAVLAFAVLGMAAVWTALAVTVGAIAAIIADDLFGLWKGEDSAIGGLIKSFQDLPAVVRTLMSAIGTGLSAALKATPGLGLLLTIAEGAGSVLSNQLASPELAGAGAGGGQVTTIEFNQSISGIPDANGVGMVTKEALREAEIAAQNPVS